jgi:Listeria-Bacteroides repeat domain (List_Bact_rpt)
MSNNVQSTLPSGKIRSVILSSGTSATNSVTFMENGGSGYMASQVGSVAANLNTNTFTKTGYSLTSWNTAANGTGTSYAPGASFNFAAGSAILYAQWTFTPPTLSLPQMSTATYRTVYPIVMTINSAGKYTFFESGKRIPGCINLAGTPPTLTCNWRPAKIGAYRISATGVINSTNYNANSAVVNVVKRLTTR